MGINLSDLGRKILIASRNELYLSMRYMDLAFSAFSMRPITATVMWARMEKPYFTTPLFWLICMRGIVFW